MAKVTSEKAVEQIGNRFNLVLAASQRARELKNEDYLSKVKGKKRKETDEYHTT